MTKRLSAMLLTWYANNRRDLPWRRTRAPYAIWISEIMLQQTTVEAVIPYYLKWMERFPTLLSLSNAPRDEVMRLWQGLGYYSRAVNLHRAAAAIVSEHGGVFPMEEDALRRLPGVGEYTAASVAALAFGTRTLPVDSLIRRVLFRFLGYAGREIAPVRRLREEGLFLVSAENPGDSIQALMDLANAVCRPKNPECPRCPIRSGCQARKNVTQEQTPPKRKTELQDIEVVVGILVKNGSVLMQRRPDGGLFAGLWELPGGKVEPGETHADAIIREWREETGFIIKPMRELNPIRHSYTRFRVSLHPFIVSGKVGKRALGERRRWVPLKDLADLAQPAANAKIWKNFFECYSGEKK